MTKLMLVMMELIILVILKVHANYPTTPSSAHTTLPTNIHLFQLDNADTSYIDHCIETTFKKCKLTEPFYTAQHLLRCLFQSPTHPKDFPINLGDHMILDCFKHCYMKLRLLGYRHAHCLVQCYEEETKKHNIKN
jgi:hypothetical protein